jgi:hypothetical protein
MNDHILNLINHLLCYADQGVTDNPHQRAIDHRLRLESIAVKNPAGDSRSLAPGESFTMFANIIPTLLDGTSTVEIKLVSAQDSVYRLKATAGPAGFRTARSVSGITTCAVTINNNAVAVFDFAGSTLTAVQVGDIMRIKGQGTYDAGPYAFNPINSGIWKVIAKSGTKISAVRQIGQSFEAVVETPALPVTNDVIFFADDKVRPGQMFQILNTFSQVTQRTYEVLNSTPDSIDFVSTEATPEETGLTYIPGSVVLYTGVKKLIYIEADQECSIRFNGSTDDTNRITPLKTGDRYLRGFQNKLGDTYSCEIVNKSINTCQIKFFSVE